MNTELKAPRVSTPRLTWKEGSSKVLIECRSGDRFCSTVDEIIKTMCKKTELDNLADQPTKLLAVFCKLMDHLAAWAQAHSGTISCAMATLRDQSLLFLVVRKEKAYEVEFEHELTQLDIEIARASEFQGVPFSVLALPACSEASRQSFVDNRLLVQFPIK